MKEELYKIKKAFPAYLEKDIDALWEKKSLNPTECHSSTFNVMISNQKIYIPERIYLVDDDYSCYTTIQEKILACYFTRHHNGFVREKNLKKIIQLNQEWSAPYIIRLIGEYVIEILDVIYTEIENIDLKLYGELIKNNMSFYNLTKQRVMSYWDCNYNLPGFRYIKKDDYVGFKIINFFDTHILKN